MSDNDAPLKITPPKAGLYPASTPIVNKIQCEDCPKSFGRKGDYRRHRNIHTGNKPHVCPHCQKPFGQKSGLMTHLNTHTGAKPYVCKEDGCTASFGDPSSCARHKKETHRVKHPYKCCHPGCESSIKRRSAFKNHLLKKHGLNPEELDIDAMAKPKKPTPSSRRKAMPTPIVMPSPLVSVPPMQPPFMVQNHLAEVDSRRLLHSPAHSYGSHSPHHVWYEPVPSVSAAPRMPEAYTAPIGSADFYRNSTPSTSSLIPYDSLPRVDDVQHSPSHVDTPYTSLWSGSTLVGGDEYYNHKDDFAHKEDYAQKDDYSQKSFYYADQQPSSTHSYSMKHMAMPEPVPSYPHHNSPTSSPPPYSKLSMPLNRLDSTASVGSQDHEDLERHLNSSKLYGPMDPPRYGHEQEADFAANNTNYPSQWASSPAWQC